MKVYTHYNTIAGTGYGYRWRTLLQFGTSWDIIGSVVMMNPGSANYKYADHHPEDDHRLLSILHTFDNEYSLCEPWFEFGSDPTLGFVAELFAEKSHVNGNKDLNGVIQVFNLFYLKEPDPGKGIALNAEFKLNEINDSIFTQDIKALTAPVYLGFGRLARNSAFRKKAEQFFERTRALGTGYLHPQFDANSFAHPRSLMLFRKNTPQSKLLRLQFCYDAIECEAISKELEKGDKILAIQNRLIALTGMNWWLHAGWDLGITFNENGNKIGIESWFGRKAVEDDDAFHIYITVWNKVHYEPYKEELSSQYPDAPIKDFGLKNRLYLCLPPVMSKDMYVIADSLMLYFNQLKEIAERKVASKSHDNEKSASARLPKVRNFKE